MRALRRRGELGLCRWEHFQGSLIGLPGVAFGLGKHGSLFQERAHAIELGAGGGVKGSVLEL